MRRPLPKMMTDRPCVSNPEDNLSIPKHLILSDDLDSIAFYYQLLPKWRGQPSQTLN